MLLAHKIELRPNKAQAEFLERSCGSKRHCYNNLLSHFSNPENKWSKKAAHAYYTGLREAFPWYGEVSARATRNAVDDLDRAFTHFFKRVKLGQTPGFPQFKRKGERDSFALREKEKFDVDGSNLRLEKLKTWIPMLQKLRFSGVAKQVTVSMRAGKWFASILVETLDYVAQCGAGSVGVDFGVKDLAVTSDGVVFPNPKHLHKAEKRLAKLQKSVSRKVKLSKRWSKAKTKVAKLHFYVAEKRKAALHAISNHVTKLYGLVTVEDLSVKGMVKNRKLSKAISGCGFGYLRQQIEYKAKLRGGMVVVADRFYASSKTCSGCGNKKTDLTMKDRVYQCASCGLQIDRDLNAAINLNKYGLDTIEPDFKRAQEQSKTGNGICGDGANKVNES